MARRRTPENAEVGSAAWVQGLADDLNTQTRKSSTTVFALDEMYGIAPIPDLANMLSEGGSQGVLVAGAVQDMALLRDRWKLAGESFATLFQDVLVFPGIRHKQTVDLISELCGEFDREMPSTGSSTGPSGMSYWQNTNIHRQRRVPPEMVYGGVGEGGNQDVLIHLSANGVGALYATPYWRSAPWPQVITSAMCNSLQAPESMWSQYVRMMGGPSNSEPPLTDLPIPDLTWWANRERGRDPWAEAYLQAKQRWEWR